MGMVFEIQDTTVVTRAEGWLSAWVGEEHVMMSAETGTCISLSETGGRIWELMDQPLSVGKLCRELAEEYEVENTVLRSEVLAFLKTMQQQRAVLTQ